LEERKRLRLQILSAPRPDLQIGIDRPWQIGRGRGVGDEVKAATPMVIAKSIWESKRPLFIAGSLLEELTFDKPAIDYAIELINLTKMPLVSVGKIAKNFLERGVKPEAIMPLVSIIDRLKDPEWKGVKGKGQHDLVIFFGIEPTVASQVLSTLKHFAPNLNTATLCPIYYPMADMPLISPPYMPHGERLAELIRILKSRKEG
jgi:acetyl-CoA decarbonylase/synthase complex subunit epsilon